jgi:hypothetical protein
MRKDGGIEWNAACIAEQLTYSAIFAGRVAEERPNGVSLYRWLRRAVEQGLLRQEVLGKCKNPFR